MRCACFNSNTSPLCGSIMTKANLLNQNPMLLQLKKRTTRGWRWVLEDFAHAATVSDAVVAELATRKTILPSRLVGQAAQAAGQRMCFAFLDSATSRSAHVPHPMRSLYRKSQVGHQEIAHATCVSAPAISKQPLESETTWM